MDQPVTEPQWITETKARFPWLFSGLDPYGFACGEGWKGIVTRLCEDLNDLARPRLKILQIKQKFGGLRVYVEGANEAAFTLIQGAEDLASTVCEWCGTPGRKTHNGWILTLCVDCQAEGRGRARHGWRRGPGPAEHPSSNALVSLFPPPQSEPGAYALTS